MKLTARVRANRANARRSTGPKTLAGKSAASRNALRHGLAIPVTVDPSLADEVERLARMIAGEGANSSRLEGARRVAEAQIDLLRVRRARSLLLHDARARAKPPSVSELIHANKQMMARRAEKQPEPWVDFDDRTRAVLCALNAVNENGDPLRLEDGIEAIAAQLVRFDRYERRALSRRKWAMRNFDEGAMDELK
jgi:hypothetical protein